MDAVLEVAHTHTHTPLAVSTRHSNACLLSTAEMSHRHQINLTKNEMRNPPGWMADRNPPNAAIHAHTHLHRQAGRQAGRQQSRHNTQTRMTRVPSDLPSCSSCVASCSLLSDKNMLNISVADSHVVDGWYDGSNSAQTPIKDMQDRDTSCARARHARRRHILEREIERSPEELHHHYHHHHYERYTHTHTPKNTHTPGWSVVRSA